MSAISVKCGNCGQMLSVPENLAGRRLGCPKCKSPLSIAARPSVAPPLPVATAVDEPLDLNKLVRSSPPPLPNTSRAGAWKQPAASGSAMPLATSGTAQNRVTRSRGNLVPWIAAAVVLLGGGAVAAYLLLPWGGTTGDFRYLPDNTDAIVSLDVRQLVNSNVGAKIKASAASAFDRFNSAMQQAGSAMKPEDFGRVTMGFNIQSQQLIGVAHTHRPLTDSDLSVPGAPPTRHEQIGGYQIGETGKQAYCLIDSYTLVVGNDKAQLAAVLQRGGPASFSPELTAAMREIDLSKTLAMACSTAGVRKGGGLGSMAGGMAMIPGGADGVRGVALQADFGDDIRLNGAVLCKDAALADQLRKMADGGIAAAKLHAGDMPPGAKKIVDGATIGGSGNVVSASLIVDSDTIAMLLSAIPGQLPKAASTPVAKVPPTASPPASSAVKPLAAPAGGSNPMEAAWRAQSSNNLKTLGLGLLGAEAKDGHFPAAAICDAGGKPLLSWRVAILPYIGEETLYKQFDLDQPWDSPKNKRLLRRMPKTFRVPGGKVHGTGMTCYLAPVGEHVAFNGAQGRNKADFKNGLSRTIMLIEAMPDRAVPWTKPDDLQFDKSNPSAGLFGQRDSGSLVLLADGHISTLPQDTSPADLRAAFTISDH
jgi:hypothetical protein